MKNYIRFPIIDDLSDAAKARYHAQMARHGKVTNMKRTLLHSISSFDALMVWYPLFEDLEKIIGKRSALFYAHAISERNDCLLCCTFFIKIFHELGIDISTFMFSEKENLLIRYGHALVDAPDQIDESLRSALKETFTEADIVLLTSFAAIMIATNLINTALQVPLDEYLFE